MQQSEPHPRVPAAGVRRSSRFVAGLLLALLLLRVLAALWPFRTVVATADPYSYLRFARDLAEGRFFVDTEVASAVQALWEGDALTDGPVWNTHVRGDGRTVHTVAIGYPLALAAALRFGGLFAALYLNHFLLIAVLGLLVLCVWEGWGRSYWALALGAAAAVAFLGSAPATFLQFSRPWREPLFYLCVLGALYALFRFLREGRPGFVLLLGLLAGYACAIKEANIVYAAWMGLYLLCSTRFRAHSRKGLLIAMGGLGGLLGLMPLLVQSWVSTGNPLLSLQFAHSATSYTELPPEGLVPIPMPGLNISNILSTYARYIDLYAASGGALFQGPALLLFLAGAVLALRSHAGRLFLGLGFVHAVLYAQWGNADFRHMFFAHIPYAVLLVLPVLLLLRNLVERVPLLRPRGDAIFVGALALAAFMPVPFGAPPDRAELYGMQDAQRLETELADLAGERALYFSNRMLRDVLGTLTRLDVMRPLELTWFDAEAGLDTAVDWFLDQGVSLFLLDNVDQDPTRVGRFNLTQLDMERLRHRFDLTLVRTLSADEYRLSPFLGRGRPELQVFEVEARRQTVVTHSLEVPPEGAAFLWLHPRSLGDALEVRLDEQPVPAPEPLHYFRALPPWAWGEAVRLKAEANGAPVPALRDAHLVGWHEPLTIDFGPDAMPGDAPWFVDEPEVQRWVSERQLASPFSLRVPVRAGPDFFTAVGLSIRWLPGAEPMPEALAVQPEGEAQVGLQIYGDAIWFPMHRPDTAGPEDWAGIREVRFEVEAPARVGLRRARLLTAHRALRLAPDPSTIGIGLLGVLAPEIPGPGPHVWRVEAEDGRLLAEGTCGAHLRRRSNGFVLTVDAASFQVPVHLQLVGAGLVHPQWVEIGAELTLTVGEPESVFLVSGFYGEESLEGAPFQWSSGTGRVQVPISRGAYRYRLVLDIADGRPEPVATDERQLHVRVAGEERVVVLPPGRAELEMEFDLPMQETAGLDELVFEVPAWVPAEAMGTGDDRSLGFQLFSLHWAPVEAESARLQ